MEKLTKARVAADEKIRKLLSESERSELVRLLEQISELVVCEEQGRTKKHSSRLAASVRPLGCWSFNPRGASHVQRMID
jgi:hypothetical protein